MACPIETLIKTGHSLNTGCNRSLTNIIGVRVSLHVNFNSLCSVWVLDNIFRTLGCGKMYPLYSSSVKIGNQISPYFGPQRWTAADVRRCLELREVIKFLQIPIMVKSTVPNFWFAEGYDHLTGSLFYLTLPFGALRGEISPKQGAFVPKGDLSRGIALIPTKR